MKPPRIETPTPPGDAQPTSRKRLPRGATSLPKEVALAEQRARLIHAVACTVADKGYVASTVSDIIRLAGVSRATFYELYADKEDCFLDGYKVQSKRHFDLVMRAFDPQAHPADQLIDALTIYIKMIDAAPVIARAFNTTVEVSTVRVRQLSEEVRAAYCDALKNWFDGIRRDHPLVGPGVDYQFTMLAAAICAFASERIQARVLEPAEAGLAMARATFALLGLYRWAAKCEGSRPSGPWGCPRD